MLQGQKLQEAYLEFIVTYSARKGLDPKTVANKKHALDGLSPFLNGREFNIDTAYEYAEYMKQNGWITPYSQLNIIKNLRAFINFLFDYDYIERNFSKSNSAVHFAA